MLTGPHREPQAHSDERKLKHQGRIILSKPILIAAALVLAIFGLIAVPAVAQEEAAIKHRKAVMKAIGGHGAMGGILKGQAKYPGGLMIHARAMADLAKVAAHVFPKGSDFGETRAKG